MQSVFLVLVYIKTQQVMCQAERIDAIEPHYVEFKVSVTNVFNFLQKRVHMKSPYQEI
jgi:hypothetical protein